MKHLRYDKEMARSTAVGAAAPSKQQPARARPGWIAAVVPDVPAEIRPLAAAALLQSVATNGFSSYVAIWAIEQLHAGSDAVGVALFLRAGSGTVTGYLGGRRSDRRGRRGVVLLGWGAQAGCIASFAAAGHAPLLGLALIVLFGPLGPPAAAASAALVGDLLGGARREAGFAAMRAAGSLAAITGPALAAGLLLAGWPVMFLGLAGFAGVAVVLAWRVLPHGRPPATSERAAGAPAPQTAARDPAFVVFLVATALITVAMAGTDRVLPISAVASYHVAATAWGLLVLLGPVLVAVTQTQVTKRLARTPRAARIIGSATLTGGPFLVLLADHGLLSIAAVVVLSTLGEMVWVPTSQALTTELAPAGRTGAYLGAYGGAVSLAFALGPLLSLEVRAAAGDGAVWLVFAGLSAVGAALGVRAVRRRA